MSEVNILIVEDEPIISEYIAKCVNEFGYKVFAKCYSVQDAISICKHRRPDIALLDINLQDEVDGIDLSHHFNREYDFPIIFITSYTSKNYLERAKRTNPSAFLIKPFDKHTLHASISLALYNYSEGKRAKSAEPSKEEKEQLFSVKESFFIKEKGKFVKVSFDEILWIESDNAYSIIHTSENRYVVISSLKKIEQRVEDFDFIRAHRSYLVNLKRIKEVTNEHVIIEENEIPIGKTHRANLFDRLNLL